MNHNKLSVNLVAAVAQNGAIGKNNTLPWKLPTDLKHFNNLTKDHTVIYGRKTFESLNKKPLPNRINIIISKTLDACDYSSCSDIVIANSLDRALWLATQWTDKVYVIGGESIYKEAMPLADRLIITHVETKIEHADAFFPFISEKTQWCCLEQDQVYKDMPTAADQHAFTIKVYRRLLEST